MFENYEELEEFVQLNQNSERRDCEFKSGVDWNDGNIKYKIVKAILSISNLRDGGYIIIGVEKIDNVTGYQLIGLSKSIADTYDPETILEVANSFTRSHVSLNVKHFEHNGKYFVVIQVVEFEDTPIICKKNHSNILQEGRIYGRPYQRVESSDNLSAEDLQEIIDLAIEKRTRRQMRLLEQLGFSIPVTTTEHTDDERFSIERADL